MENAKICDLDLIENRKKKNKKEQKTKLHLSNLKNNLFSVIEKLIDYEPKIQKKEEDLKPMLIKFTELYININRNLKNQNLKNKFIKEIVNEMTNDIIFRCDEKTNISKEITILKKTKNENNK